MEGTLGRGQGRGKDTEVQKSTAWLETLQMTLREGPDQEASGSDLEGRQEGEVIPKDFHFFKFHLGMTWRIDL